jgi:phosphonate transport system permease protein
LTFPTSRASPDRLSLIEAQYCASLRLRRCKTLLSLGLAIAALVLSGRISEVDLLGFVSHIDRFTGYFVRIVTLESGASVLSDPAEWFWNLGHWLGQIAQTLVVAYLGLVFGGAGAFVLGFAAASNLSNGSVTRFAARRLLEFFRTVPELVFAMIFVVAFGLGPLAGLLALMLHTAGAMGKQFFEVIENADLRILESIEATGGGRLAGLRFGILPQVLPSLASYALFRFEINLRQSTILGLVGAGGIGQDLMTAIHQFYYPDVSAILVLIILAVAAIDLVTDMIRRRLIGQDMAQS